VTKNHIRVDGTNIYLIVPEGFNWIAQSRTFVNPKINVSIIINVMEFASNSSETSIDLLHKEMSKDKLLSQGSLLQRDKPITVNGLKGYLVETKRQTFKENFLSHILIFGKENLCFVVQTIFPESDKQFEKQSRQLINSVVYKDIIPVYNKTYSMDFDKYSFELIESKNNVDRYQTGSTSISIEQFFTKGNTDTGTIFYSRMQRLPFSSTELGEKGIEEIIIDNLNCLHASIDAINENVEKVYLYMLLISNNDKLFQILGTCQSASQLSRIIEISKTFKSLN
jgi:hypothetical protein